MAITETGYHRSTYEELLTEFTLKAKELFGEDIDTSDQSPLGKIIKMMAYYRAKDHEDAEYIYFARFPNTTNGMNLDRLCPIVGLSRNVAIPARYQVTVTGEEGTTIPVGFLVSTESDIEYYNIMEATIAAGETTCTITVECTVAGIIGNVVASDIKEIVNPEAGIDSVVGTAVVSLGADEESDYELRNRITAAGEGSGTGNVASIRSSLLKVPTVTSAFVYENDTDEVDSIGIPPHSIACYVAGGTGYTQQIGDAIFSTKAAGIATHGNITVTVLDDGGYPHTVKYNTMEIVPVTVAISIVTTVDFEGEVGIAKIKENVTNYINSLSFGNDVILSQLYGYIYSVNGVAKVTSITLNGGTNDISITDLQYANCTSVTVAEV